MLTKPCQVEVIQFGKPYLLVFFFDRTKHDFIIRIYQEKWKNLDVLVKKLIRKYSSLKLRRKKLFKMLLRCRHYKRGIVYSIDWIKDVCCISFTHDPRVKGSPLP